MLSIFSLVRLDKYATIQTVKKYIVLIHIYHQLPLNFMLLFCVLSRDDWLGLLYHPLIENQKRSISSIIFFSFTVLRFLLYKVLSLVRYCKTKSDWTLTRNPINFAKRTLKMDCDVHHFGPCLDILVFQKAEIITCITEETFTYCMFNFLAS